MRSVPIHTVHSANESGFKASYRVRLTALPAEVDIKTPLRRGASKKELMDFRISGQTQTSQNHLNGNRQGKTSRGMYAIGG